MISVLPVVASLTHTYAHTHTQTLPCTLTHTCTHTHSHTGDQNQLPPVVASPSALEHGLGVSLFARLAAGGMKPSLLNEQYRMHPKIAEFSSVR